MFQIGDSVRHKTARITGTVIGYGIRNSDRAITLKVKLSSDKSIETIAEDVCDRWKIHHKRVLACTLPHFPKHKLSKAA